MKANWKNIAALSSVGFALAALLWYVWRRLLRDGMSASGYFDDEPYDPESNMKNHPTYEQQPVPLTHFKINEFDSPDVPGSGKKMRVTTLSMLDAARTSAAIPFRINSGFRTTKHNTSVGGQNNSAHTRGYACDIHAPTLEDQIKVVKAAREAGFNRFGIYATFVHVDNDPSKTPNVAWDKSLKAVRKGGDFSKMSFNPFEI